MSNAPSPTSPGHRFGGPREPARSQAQAARAETGRAAAAMVGDAVLRTTHRRLKFASVGFACLFAALAAKLADDTVFRRIEVAKVEAPRRPAPPPPPGTTLLASMSGDLGLDTRRASILDRNGEILAVSLPTVALGIDPNAVIDEADTAHRLAQALPRLDEKKVRERLSRRTVDGKPIKFVYLARQITPREQYAINALGIPGVTYKSTERRRYPLGRVAAQVLGGVDVEGRGWSGVERFFEQRLTDPNNREPLRLSIDVRVQAVVRDELQSAMTEFNAIGACGIVMDVRSGEVIAMVNLPDYDANQTSKMSDDIRLNRAVAGRYEPGSTFKLQTAAMALDSGAAQVWNIFDAVNPIKIGRFTITDFEGKHRMLSLPEVLVYSSNLGAARIAVQVGTERQRAWLGRMGMFGRLDIELPETRMPLVPPQANWKEVATMTIGFGHGIAVSPLHVVRGTAAIANGGILVRPTIVALPPDSPPPQGERVMQQSTSDIMRKIMRLVVTDGYGKPAEVAGYFVGGKTGTAEKVDRHGGYKKHTNVSAFMSVFPMNAPRYAVYMMLDEPKANASSHGYATAGWVSAPAAGKVIGRIGPMLGLLPLTDADAAAAQASLTMPLEPGRGWSPQSAPRPAQASATPRQPTAPRPPALTTPVPLMPTTPIPRDLRHEARYATPVVADR